MKVLIITTEWPSQKNKYSGIFIQTQVEELRQHVEEVNVFSFSSKSNPFNYLLSWIKLRKNVHYKNADILHIHFGYAGLVALSTKKPFILTLHGSDVLGVVDKFGKYKKIKSFISNKISLHIAKKSSRIIAVSDRIYNLIKYKEKMIILPIGIDCKKFFPMDKQIARNSLNLDFNKKYILFPANPSNPIKRFSLAKQVEEILKNEFDIELLTLNNIDHEFVPLIMNSADVLLLTSIHEGSPTVIKEALGCGLPIVSLDIGDVKTQIQNIDGCFISPDDSPKTLASLIVGVINNYNKLDNKIILSKISEANNIKKLIEIYHEILNGRQ